ncbi:glycosyltransferase [Hansschlegelia zhihuaiae]|nr:glycosyltransferase [Hansschlegelia zhihuaiae]
MNRRVLIASDYGARDAAYSSLSYEFCKVAAECDDAHLVAPKLRQSIVPFVDNVIADHIDRERVQRDVNRLLKGVRRRIGMRDGPTIEPFEVDREYELFVYIAYDINSLVELSRVKGWRERCSKAVVAIHELWSTELASNRTYLSLLDRFDHVFVLSESVAEKLQSHLGKPCEALPSASDTLVATPFPDLPERVIDLYSFGSRRVDLHEHLIDLVAKREIFYVYDSLSSTDSRMRNWREHRFLLADTMRRSRYFLAFDPASLTSPRSSVINGESVLPGRLFEGVAGGAAIIGFAPRCREFKRHFDWPDAVIDVPADPRDFKAFLSSLDLQTDRMDRLRRTNAIQALRRHDWAYRWERILRVGGLEPHPKLEARKSRLRALADAAEFGAAAFDADGRGDPREYRRLKSSPQSSAQIM